MSQGSKSSFIETYGFSEAEYQQRRRQLDRLCAPNASLPHCSIDEFKHFRGLDSGNDFGLASTVEVPVKLIVDSSSLRSWADVDDFDTPHSLDRLWQIYQSMSQKGFLSSEPVYLYDFGGLLCVNSGQRRTMIAKALEIKTISAKVIQKYPTEIIIPSSAGFDWLSQQKEQGRWTGNMNFSLDHNGLYQNGQAQIFSHQGLWLFTQHPEKMEQIYHQINASGQANLFI